MATLALIERAGRSHSRSGWRETGARWLSTPAAIRPREVDLVAGAPRSMPVELDSLLSTLQGPPPAGRSRQVDGNSDAPAWRAAFGLDHAPAWMRRSGWWPALRVTKGIEPGRAEVPATRCPFGNRWPWRVLRPGRGFRPLRRGAPARGRYGLDVGVLRAGGQGGEGQGASGVKKPEWDVFGLNGGEGDHRVEPGSLARGRQPNTSR